MSIGDNVLTADEIKAEQVSVLAGELEEVRAWIAQLKDQVDVVHGCLVAELTDMQRGDHCDARWGGCLVNLFTLIEEAP